MPLCYDSLPGHLRALLQAGHVVTVRWDCGGDDHVVTTQVDGVEQEINLGENYYDYLTFREIRVGEDYHGYLTLRESEYEAYLATLTNLPLLLGGYLAERLGLPSVGEFELLGGGQITLADGALVLTCRSEATTYVENPDGWWPEEYLSAAELAELCPERLQPGAPDPAPLCYLPDPAMAAGCTGRVVLFELE